MTDLPTARADGRVVFIDVARVLATLMMLLGHTVDALLDPAFRGTAAFSAWTFLRALTPTTFMLVSGFALSLVAMHVSRRESPADGAMRRLRRFGFFLLVGYAMHYPAGSLLGLLETTDAGWRSFLMVDVLHCIAVTLAVLQLLAMRVRDPSWFLVVTAALAMLFGFLTPLAWRWTPGLPLVLSAYVNPATGSIFPLFPWLAFGAFGAAAGSWYLLAGGDTPGARARRTLLPLGAAALGAALLMRMIPWEPFDAVSMGAARPSQFLLQAGVASLFLSALASLVDLRPGRLPRLEDFAQESLTIYVVHVCLVYGSPWNSGLRQWFGASLAPLQVAGAVVALWALMIALALSWTAYRRRHGTAAIRMRTALVTLLLALLLV